ncbi:MAG: DUF4476 domain-containing protein [Bacteroidetes bacterium]|nr:MAG: DUF4476 domain-containing protein [Bacteroidota bacterium]
MKKSAHLSASYKEATFASHFKSAGNVKIMTGFLATLILMLLLPIANANGHPAASELHLRLHDNAFFTVVINNQQYNHISNQHVIGNLRPGRHYMQVIRYNTVYNGFGYSFQHPTVIFSGHINIKGRHRIFAMIDHRGRYRIEDSYVLHHAPPSYHQGYAPAGYHYMPPVMGHQAFAMLKNTIASTSFDSSRLKIAEQAIAASNVTSAQVYELMQLLTFESNRLKLAQFAYAYTVDKHNYFLVNRAFSFNSSITRLNSYIAHNF